MSLIFTTSPPSVTTYAVFPMISTELGRSSPPATGVMVPFAFTRSKAPLFGSRRRSRRVSAVVGQEVGRTRPVALRESEQRLPATDLDIDGEASTGGDARCRRRSGFERHDLPVLRLVRHGAGFRHVDRVSTHREPCGDDVSELDHLRDRSVQRDAIHAVVMSVGDEEPTAERFERILHAGRQGEGRRWRVVASERADVRDECRTRGPVDAVDPDQIRDRTRPDPVRRRSRGHTPSTRRTQHP